MASPGKLHAPEPFGTWGEKSLSNHAGIRRDPSYLSYDSALCHHKLSFLFLCAPQQGLVSCPGRGLWSSVCFLEPPLSLTLSLSEAKLMWKMHRDVVAAQKHTVGTKLLGS